MEIEYNVKRIRRLVFISAYLGVLLLVAVFWFVSYVFLEPYEQYTRFASVALLLSGLMWYIWNYIDSESRIDTSEVIHVREFYETLYEQSPLPYLTITTAGTIITSNIASSRLFGLKQEALTDKNFFQFLVHEDENILAMCLSKVQNGIPINEEEMQLKLPNGGIRWISLSVFINQTFNQLLVSMVDITNQKKIDLAKSEFAALVTHQLRTPVAAIRWNVELFERTLSNPHSEIQEKYLDKIKRNITRMIELINDFLSVSKLETGTFEAEQQTIQVKQYFDSVVDEYLGSITEKNILIQRISNPEDLVLSVDTRLFHIITSNLLSNAIKYTPTGGTVTFGYEATKHVCAITVTDTGIGIPIDDQSNLFTKFYRASNAIRHKAEGTGLGLYIVKQSVEKLGGTIALDSTENKGTTFTVTIPRT